MIESRTPTRLDPRTSNMTARIDPVTVSELFDGEDPRVVTVLVSNPWGTFRRYPVIHRAAQRKFETGVFRKQLARTGAHAWIAESGGSPVGLAVIAPLEWDTGFFGLAMGALTLILSDADLALQRATASALVPVAMEQARADGHRHVSARVDVADVATIHTLEDSGFRLMDTLHTYCCDGRRFKLQPVPRKATVRPFRPEDTPAVLEVGRRAFEGYRSRYVVDPAFPPEASSRFYEEWTARCCDGTMADTMLVAADGERIIGFLGWRYQADLREFTGLRLLGGGLGACIRERFGAFRDLLSVAAELHLPEADVLDFETQAFNYVVRGYYQELGFHPVRSRHAMRALIA